jgi:tRNA pseudouridine38-40 synthase
MPKAFSKDEIAADDRKPKRKVAVLLGYSGSGYKGMQMMNDQKTIEGDLFAAFVAAGAISKANADDPKKSSFSRCARTDKGVHAAGNLISIKLIIEDPDIVQKINEALPPQIRIWGIERTTGSFNCYQACDSRWYEYLIPTHCFLPPHPQSYLGQKLVEIAAEADNLEGYKLRQEEVADFWEQTDLDFVKPILEGLDDEIRTAVEQALYRTQAEGAEFEDIDEDIEIGDESTVVEDNAGDELAEETATSQADTTVAADESGENAKAAPTAPIGHTPLDEAIRALKASILKAKQAYRISPARLARITEIFGKYKGTYNFHNFTIRKSPNDPASQRHIKSFTVNQKPILINDTEWLSLKVHGQSFMMHQIRKMVGMAALVVRCGTPPERLEQTLGQDLYSIPKAPGLGLLLERPVFDNYNETSAKQNGRDPIDFSKYEKAIEDFKRKDIYDRIFREEDRDHTLVHCLLDLSYWYSS